MVALIEKKGDGEIYSRSFLTPPANSTNRVWHRFSTWSCVAADTTPQRSFGTLILQSVTAGERWGVSGHSFAGRVSTQRLS